MDKRYRIKVAFQNYVVGAITDLDETMVPGLLAGGFIEEVVEDEAAAKYRKATEDNYRRIAEEAAAAGAKRVLAEAAAMQSGIHIEVGETEEEKIGKTGGFKNFTHFITDVYHAGLPDAQRTDELDRWVKVAGEMAENDNVQGGFLVPTEHKNELLSQALEMSIVAPRAREIPMQTNRIDIPAINDTSHNSSVYGGIIMYRPGEGAQKDKSKPALRKISLTLHKLTGLIYVSDELMEDSPISVAALINQTFPEALAYFSDDDYLWGTGANMPLGVLNAANPALIAQAAEPAQAATTIIAENIFNMWSRLYPRGQANAVWIANNDTFPQLATMTIAVGAGGVPVFMPANGISGTPYATLMGRPLILSEKSQTLGTQGDIALLDLSQYFIGRKAGQAGGIRAAQSIHLRFDYDQTVFRFVMRHDGQPSWNSPLTPRRSAITLSPYVVLAGRP